MAKLDRMMGAMVLKDDLKIAKLEVVKQMRSEFIAQIEPLRAQVEATATNVPRAREGTKALNARLVEMENAARQQVNRVEALAVELKQLKLSKPKATTTTDDSFRKLIVTGFHT